ncbi:MAG: MFS transporter [Deltaproteobacteria bacterium]|nr:MFS transporter [Deltaproteobacteria bacterium]MBW2498900.1 MFS transporter [Deltaproteobacteria bacterium]
MSPTRAARTRLLGDLRGRALLVVIGCLICQMGLGFTYVARPLAQPIMEELALSRTQFSAANGPQLLLQALASPLVGYLAVRLGASLVLAASAVLFTAVFLFFSGIQGAIGLYVAIAGAGIASAGMGDVTIGHVVSQWIRKRRGLALGIVYTGSSLGGALMVELSSSVAELWSWREGLLSISAVAFVILLPTSLLLVREPPTAAAADLDAESRSANEPSYDLKAALRTRSFWILTGSLFTYLFYFVGMLDHLVLFLMDEGMSRLEATRYYQQALLLGGLSKIVIGLIADRIPYRQALLLDYGLLAGSSFLLLIQPDMPWLPIFVFSYGVATAARDVVYPLIIGHCFGVRYLGEIYGTMMLTLFPGGALGPIFAAAVHDRFGSYDLAFQVFAVMNGLALAALFFVRDERKAARALPPSGESPADARR